MKKFIIKDPETGLYSTGRNCNPQVWTSNIEEARMWDDIGPLKNHITRLIKDVNYRNGWTGAKQMPTPYVSNMEIVTVELEIKEVSAKKLRV